MSRGRVWAWRLLRWTLGGVFVAAGVLKMMDPLGFAEAIRNYRMVPWWSLNGLALLLPWVEVVAAAALIAGIWTREAAAILMVLLVVYLGATAGAVARGLDIRCGCFGPYDTSNAWVVMARAVGLLVMAAVVLAQPRAVRSS